MLYKIYAYLIKLALNPIDVLGRMFTFNNEMPKGSRIEKDIAYGQHRLQRYDLILPDKPNPNAPVIAYIHGGGWVVGHKNGFRRMGAVWARLGFPVININYRLGPRHNWRAQTHDIHNAIQHAQARLAKSEGHSQPLILAGDSAGAHLSSWYAAAAHNP